MSESLPPEPMDDSEPPQEKSQLSEGILNALRQLQDSSVPATAVALTPTPPNSQDPPRPTSVRVPEPTPPPQSEWEQLRAQLREKPVDADGWQKLVDLAEDSGDIEKIKETYEGMLETYPNTPSIQIAYLRHFLDDPSQFGSAEKLFRKFLEKKAAPSVDLLKVYLTYIRRITTGQNARDVIRKCYDFALGHVGQDKDSYDIWQQYINFLKADETKTTWEESQNMDAIRRAYQQAVQIPMENVKRLWEDYQEFENNLNKITAKKFISDLQENHMQARTVLNQLQEHLTVLYPLVPGGKDKRPSIWLPRPPTFNHGDKALVARWRLYLKWEEGNPLEMEESNRSAFLQRVQSVYKKAIVRMRFYSEIWYMAYAWTNSVGKTEEALALLKAGIDANPASFVLNFAYAEALELQGDFTEVHATFDKFLETLRKDLEALETRVNVSNGSSSSQQQSQTQPNGEGPTSNHSSFNTQSSDEKPPKNKELSDKRTDYGIAWIVYIRFARRAEGLKSARNVFSKARRDRWTPWEVHEAEALMEYHCGSKDATVASGSKEVTVASRIFEKAMELYSDEVEFVLRYLSFLISINDENNARALFERVIGTFSPDKARPLWERWSKYEYQYGDLAAAHKLEKRMAEVYPNDPPIKRFAERHKYSHVDSIATRDLGFVLGKSGSGSARTNGSSSGLLGRSDTLQSIVSDTAAKSATPTQGSSSSKRASSPDHRRRDESRDYPSKRARPSSPGSGRGRDRDRWDGPPHRRHGSPMWEREREREVPPPSSRGRFKEEKEKEEDKSVQLPSVLTWFIGTLPAPSSFDGPVFRTDDLMQHFRNAVIPSSNSSGKPRSPPPPPRSGGGGRPPPDYGPYQGPGSGGRRGRW